MLTKAMELCGASFGVLRLYDGKVFDAVAVHGDPRIAERIRQLGPIRPASGSLFEPLVQGQEVLHIADLLGDDAYRADPKDRERIEAGGIRTWLAVALRKHDALLGAIIVYRKEMRLFTDKQIALLQNFAAQAVIAMENARLITETREALDQQTATAEVLGVINSSPGNLGPVFDAILDKAHTLCGAEFGSLQVYDGQEVRAVAARGLPDAFVYRLRQGFRPEANHPVHALWMGDRVIQLDMAELDNTIGRAAFELGGMRTVLFVPLRSDAALLGYITAARPEVRDFSEKEIALLENFAAQAVIAMENARLITETREALEQQQAIAEILQVINQSPGDLQPVFDILLDRAMRVCEAAFGILAVREGERTHGVATQGLPSALAEWRRNHPVIDTQNTLLARVGVRRRSLSASARRVRLFCPPFARSQPTRCWPARPSELPISSR